MKAIGLRFPATAFLLGLLVGCGSMKSVDPSQYASMDCSGLNAALGVVATDVTRNAFSRGTISNADVPLWLPGGQKAVSLLKDRRTAEIERLQAQGAAIEATRNRRCKGEL